MFPPSQSRAELQIVDAPVDAQRTHWHYRHWLGGTLASDDIRLPFVGVDVRAGEPREGVEPSEMGTVAVRQHDVLEVLDRTSDGLNAFEDGTVRLWEMLSGKPHSEPLEGHDDEVRGAAFSPDGNLLASSSDDKTVRLWDVASGTPHDTLTGHGGEVRGVAFSPDGKLLASSSEDQGVQLWDAASGEAHGQPLTGHTNSVNDVAFSKDGNLLASASVDETVRLWDIELESLIADACRIANRNLSEDEWSRFVGPESVAKYELTCSSVPVG